MRKTTKKLKNIKKTKKLLNWYWYEKITEKLKKAMIFKLYLLMIINIKLNIIIIWFFKIIVKIN